MPCKFDFKPSCCNFYQVNAFISANNVVPELKNKHGKYVILINLYLSLLFIH
jgi:hypothetical protein